MAASSLRIFLAGATGVIGSRLLPLLLAEGHSIAAMTRTPAKLDQLRTSGVTPLLCDLFDRSALIQTVVDFRPDVILHQVTDLPDEGSKIAEFRARNQRVRSEGTSNLLAASQATHARSVVAQSIAWSGGPVVDAHEQTVSAAGGTVLRYGQFYGPDTYYPNELPAHPRIHVDVAATRTMEFLIDRPGVFTLVDSE